MATPKASTKVPPTVLKVFGLVDVKRVMRSSIAERYAETNVNNPNLILGLELEIEGWRGDKYQLDDFTYTEDGSLRNQGKEVITYPVQSKYVSKYLDHFFEYHEINQTNYSERCSTHVHMNVQDFTIDNLKVLALVYQTVERLLFRYVGNDREDNIFCVPWYQSGLSPSFIDRISRDPNMTIRGWMKYSALNFLPVRSQGTVEFRHMPGTCDMDFIMGWVNILGCLAKYAKTKTFEDVSKIVLEMNTVSNYHAFLESVFEQYTGLLDHENSRELLSTGVIDSKLMLRELKDHPELRDHEAGAPNPFEALLGRRAPPLRAADYFAQAQRAEHARDLEFDEMMRMNEVFADQEERDN